MTVTTFHHRVMVKGGNITLIADLIERKLGVKCYPRWEYLAHPDGLGVPIDFYSNSPDANLDFLRPEILPPK